MLGSIKECIPNHKKSDVYSYGITLYEMVTQKKAWDKLPSTTIKNLVLNNVRPEFECEDLIVLQNLAIRCWSMDSKDRPMFEDILNDLK